MTALACCILTQRALIQACYTWNSRFGLTIDNSAQKEYLNFSRRLKYVTYDLKTYKKEYEKK